MNLSFAALRSFGAGAGPRGAGEVSQNIEKINEFGDATEISKLRPLVRAVAQGVLREASEHPDVDDVVAETLRRALEGADRRTIELRPWVLGIARHVALDVLRSRQRRRQRELPSPREDDGPPPVEQVPDLRADADPFQNVARAEEASRIRACLATLPPGPKQALSLFHLEGLSYRAIGERLGVPVGTVATWVLRGRKALLAEVGGDHA